jgi:hypothetical protein
MVIYHTFWSLKKTRYPLITGYFFIAVIYVDTSCQRQTDVLEEMLSLIASQRDGVPAPQSRLCYR